MRLARTLLLALFALASLAALPARAHDVAGELTNKTPVASIKFSGDANVGDTVHFDGSGSSDPDGTVRDYEWDFSDGTTAVGPTADHVWNRPGTYLVSLVVHDNQGEVGMPAATQLVRIHGAAGEPPYTVKTPQLLSIPLDDGIHDTAKLFQPDSGKPCPVIIAHANDPAEGIGLGGPMRAMVESGFCYLHVTARGQGTSQGLVTYTRRIAQDGYDIVEWAAAQPWDDGHNAFVGGSNYGYRGWMAMSTNAPHLTTASLGCTPNDTYRDIMYTGGIPSINGFAIFGTLAHGLAAQQGDTANRAQNDATVMQASASHPLDDAYWHQYDFNVEDVQEPVLYQCGWSDVFYPRQGFEFFRKALRRTGGKLVIWPGGHGAQYPNPVDPTGLANADTRTRLWFEEKMMGIDHNTAAWPPVLAYRMEGGWVDSYLAGKGQWIGRSDWPVPGTEWTRYYLDGPGRALGTLSTTAPPALDAPDVAVPAPQGASDGRFNDFYGQLVGNNVEGHTGSKIWPAYYAAGDETVDDAGSLTYQTAAFDHPVEVTGPITLTLYVQAMTTDADFVAQISDVDTDGHARWLCNGMLRSSLRKLDETTTERDAAGDITHPQYTFDESQPLTPGSTYELDIEIYPTSNLFDAGHRLRLDISQIDVPMTATTPQPALVLHDAAHPSRLLLPIQPAS